MTKRQFLAYAFGESFAYFVTFENSGVENHKEFCEKQRFDIEIYNLDGPMSPLITLERAI